MLIELYRYIYSSSNQSGKGIWAGKINTARNWLFNQTYFNLNLVFRNIRFYSAFIALSGLSVVVSDFILSQFQINFKDLNNEDTCTL